MKKNQKLRIIMTIIITAVITFSITLLWLYGKPGNEGLNSLLGTVFESDKLMTKLDVISKKIDEEYVGDEVDENKMLEGAVKGYVAGLGDAYSEYYSPDEMEDYYTNTVGSFVGIGVEIIANYDTNEVEVYRPIEGSPAEKAGLKAGDVLLEVDGTICTADDFDNIPNRIKGKIGTKVKIKVRRTNENKEEEILEFEIDRNYVDMVRVTSQMINKNIGYIYISTFDGEKVAEQFEEAYDKLVEDGAKSLIVDIRTNSGGIVTEAVDIADLFTDKGENLLIEREKSGKEYTTKAIRDKKIKMNTVLLVNEFSASASEILTAVAKELADNVTVVGRTTYGKGVIQTLYGLSDGSGIKLTTEEYFTPNHNKINGKGITPDVEVADDEVFNGELDLEKDKSIKKAIELLKN